MKISVLKKGDVDVNAEVQNYVEEKLQAVRDKYLKNYSDEELFFEVEIVEGEKEKTGSLELIFQ